MPKHPIAAPASSPLARALDRNEAIQENVEQSAAELCVISTVLKQEVPVQAQTGDVAQALQKTGELEGRIQSSAEELAQVNQALKAELQAREALERELAQAQARLAQAQQRAPGSAPAAAPGG